MVVSSLVDFDKNGVGDMFVDDTGEPGWVVHKQIVTHELHPFAHLPR